MDQSPQAVRAIAKARELEQELELASIMSQLPYQQQRVLPYLMMGVSQTQAAALSGVPQQTISKWYLTDSLFCDALRRLREQRLKWTIAYLGAAGYRSIEVLIDCISIDPFDPRIVAMGESIVRTIYQERRRAAQFLVDQLGLKRSTMEVVHRHEGQVDATLHVTPSTVEVLARRLDELRRQGVEIADISYRQLPDSAPAHGEVRIDPDSGRVQCHACQGWYIGMEDHIATAHAEFASFGEYCEHYGLSSDFGESDGQRT